MNTPESTLFNAVPVVSELNRVAGFDPLRFLKKTANGHELDLRYKKLWFRLKYPAGRTRLTPLRITDQLAIIEAKVFFDKDDADPASSYIATMTQENAPAGLYIQAAEHDALDMALTNAGFGIQFAPMPKADTPYAEPTTPVMRSKPAPAPQAAAEQVRTEPAAVRADIEPVVVQQPEQEVVHHAEKAVVQMREAAEKSDLPIDGLVLTYDEVDYSRTCGRTGHHFKDGLAFKFEDELYESVLRDIEWTPSRTGEIAPVAVLDSVVIDGCSVSRASLHNLSFIEGLELMPGCRVLVSKRNMIIPHIEENLERGHFDLDAVTPKHCPCCGAEMRFHITDGGKKALFCDNPDCAMRKLRRFVHFASKKAMDIEGLSEATLERLIARGWLHSFTDVYRLDHYMQEIICMDGFGEKSWDNLWGAIQRSRNTTFERYLIAMDIPMIGNHASKVLAKQFGSSPSAFEEAVENDFDFSQLPDFGETLRQNIHQWFAQEENRILWEELQEMVTIQTVTTETHSMEDNPFVGCTMVVTGKVEPYTRSGINAKIESLGAVAGSSVTKKTDYLICGENAGSKLDKARALGIRVLSPGEFFRMIGE